MKNISYINVMVNKEDAPKQVEKLCAGLDVTTRVVDERVHGYIIRVGSSDPEALNTVKDRGTYL